MRKIFWFLAALLAVSVALNVWQYGRKPVVLTEVIKDTVWRDSVVYEPGAVESVLTGKVIYVKVPTHAGTDTVRDSVTVELPVEQKRYEDSLYTAWVSGYMPKLDSLRLHLPEVTTTVTKTVVSDVPRWSFGVQAGAGYGITTKQTDFFVGIGVSVRLWPSRSAGTVRR